MGRACGSPSQGDRARSRYGRALHTRGRASRTPAGDPGLDAQSRRVRGDAGGAAAGRGLVRADELARPARRGGQRPCPAPSNASIARVLGRLPCHSLRADRAPVGPAVELGLTRAFDPHAAGLDAEAAHRLCRAIRPHLRPYERWRQYRSPRRSHGPSSDRDALYGVAFCASSPLSLRCGTAGLRNQSTS